MLTSSKTICSFPKLCFQFLTNVFEFLSAIPHAEFEEINEAAHMVAGDRNDIFVEAALKFLKKVIST